MGKNDIRETMGRSGRIVCKVMCAVFITFSFVLDGYAQLIEKRKTIKYPLYNFFKDKDNETAEMIRTDFAVNGWRYPEILKKVGDSMLVSNPIAYETDKLAEYITENRRNAKERLLPKCVVNEWELIKFLGHESDYHADAIKQLNYYDQRVYCLYERNASMRLISYDTVSKVFSVIMTLRDDIKLKRYINNIEFDQTGDLLLIANNIINSFMIIDVRAGNAFYQKLPGTVFSTKALAVKGDLLFFIESSDYSVMSMNYKTSSVSSLGKLSFAKKGKDGGISYYMDPDKMMVYVSYLDFVDISLVTSVYELKK